MGEQSYRLAFRNAQFRGAVVLFVAFAVLAVTVSAQDSKFVLLDGESLTGKLSAISKDGAIEADGLSKPLELDLLRRIERVSATSRTSGAPIQVDLAGGGWLFANGVSIAKEKCIIDWEYGQGTSLSIDAVRAVHFNPKTKDEGFERALREPSQFDRVFAIVGEKQIQPLTGLVVELSAEGVEFEFRGRKQNLPRAKLFGIVLAQVGGQVAEQPGAIVHLCEGSQLSGRIELLKEGRLTLDLLGAGGVDIPWDAVAVVHVRSSRIAYISDIGAVQEEQSPIVTLARSWQRDLSVMGKPLKLRDGEGLEQAFEKGIGTHAASRLTIEIAGTYDEFAATIGIDAETEGRGDCVFVVLADGNRVYSQQVKGTDAARVINVNVSGVKALTLLVESGADLDLADHADWCDARLIRTSKK